MEEIRVLQEDDYKTMADKIFNHFTVMQSCKVIGVLTDSGRLVEKGRAVLERLEYLHEQNNTYNGKLKKVKPRDSVGGILAHKIFKYNRVISNDEIKYTIWRFQ